MRTTDTSEKGLEALIARHLTGYASKSEMQGGDSVAEERCPYGGVGYLLGDSQDFDRDYAVDIVQLRAFLQETQPQIASQLALDTDNPTRQKFLARLQGEITKRGIVYVLRHGISHTSAAHISLFYGSPSERNQKAREQFAQNRFSITRQLHYSKNDALLSLDLCLFINGLPVATFELKNSLTRQTVREAVEQYQRDRNPRELLFQFGRCMAHFAVDDHEVRFCTELKGNDSWFLPFNKGYNDGAGNPPNPDGVKTDYLWREVLTKEGLTDIIENYAQIVEKVDERTGRKKREAIFPRYHQRDVVHKLLADVQANGVGKRYLIQHSAGSGKSNSIAWLAHQLVEIERDSKPLLDSVIVVTDRVILDKQLKDTIKQFAQVGNMVGHADGSGQLREFIQQDKKIIITTVQKFPFILNDIGDLHRGNSFAIIIDEAHSSQSGSTAAKMNIALSNAGSDDEEEDTEDRINRIMEGRKMLSNASYFAFTATPKNKTLEIFGEPETAGDGTARRAFHSYTMKQAIQEGFILDVLQNYTPVQSYYNLVKTIEDDPEFDTKKAQRKLRYYVESHEHAILQKAEIMVDHFHSQVLAKQKIGGQARAMVVTSGIPRAIEYYHAFTEYLKERKSPYKAIVAFSGKQEIGGVDTTEATLNGFSSKYIVDKIQEDPYRFLICADKYQTGYDEPLLHTMYVDKGLSGIKAVQTLSRLNRARPKKRDTFVLDFQNDADTIQAAFDDYYRTTILSSETDPNKLHDLKTDLDGYQVYADSHIEALVERYLGGESRERLDPILDGCVQVYCDTLDEDGQVDFKSKAKAFVRTYGFLASVLPYSIAAWEKLSIFLNFLIPKLPAPKEEDFSKGVLESIDMDSYRVEVRSALAIALTDSDAEIEPVPASGGGHLPEPELDRLSNILKTFNEQWGDVVFNDADRIRLAMIQDIPSKVSADTAYQNAMQNSDKQNAEIEHNRAVDSVMVGLVADHTELYKLYSDDPSFKKWLRDIIFQATYQPPPRP
ncbi:MAG: type I restriction endonuclease subunit R [Armatimonadetes bacterium]|nr:type I restriction endonuclease subunit R [Armatimonadota bacterium]